MSKFLKALEQAQRDRALGSRGRPAAARPEVVPPHVPREVPPPPPPPVADPPPATAFQRPPVPRAPEEIPDGVDDHLVSLVDPTAFEAEQYRALRYLIEQKHRTDSSTVIAVSSAGVGDGKTTTAINLAGALAQAPEARVLLVEADLRRPSIGDQLGFDASSRAGLVHAILNPGLSLAQVTRARAPFNLNVVLAGQVPPSPYEILKSPRLIDLLDEARGTYDYVVLDTPPLVGFQDSRVITRLVDGIILVVGAHRTPKRMVEEALNLVDPAKMLGFVFNGDDQGLARFYSRHYYRRPDTSGGSRTHSWGRRALKKMGTSFATPDRAGRRPQDADGDFE
jgi:capsular exopolysaccharide synthesis family protein